MSVGNTSFVKDFFIVGFPGLQPHYYGLVSALLFFVYLFTLMENGVFFTLFVITKSLHRPVYYFIINLVVCDVLLSTTTLPKIISRYWFQDGTISFLGCFVQMFFVHYLGGVISNVLAVMAIDRYAAICYPLQYHNIMTHRNMLILILGCWLLSLAGALMLVIRAYPLPYCAENTIIHCYCEHVSVTTLACTNRSLYSIPALIYALAVMAWSIAIIAFSYCSIFKAVMRISGSQGRMKTFSTCSPQLIIIALHFLPKGLIYLFGNIGIKFDTDLRLIIIIMSSQLPPMINPLIYSLRTEEDKKILKRPFQNKLIGFPLQLL
ncbi:odorant receptor 103-3 [Danio rerio]|uniref:Odorant receptor n=1 Tax=Danio rerio TaxID=7955 RepID=Q2PRB9_DANRE|nr:odorant receptor 103-3 [Danio rerio]ABC43348.1 odorant receptor [Danio rerio]|eukprot:NP_001121851.1 odorant receptor [Danio rerio]